MKSARSFLGAAVVLTVGMPLAQSCSSDVARAPGAVGSSCSTDAACNGGLVCLSQICVQPAAVDAGGGVGSGGRGGGGGIGVGGAAGARLGMDCTPSSTTVPPASGLIADFTGVDGGPGIAGTIFPYPDGSASAPTATVSSGALHLTENHAGSSSPQYVGVALVFAGCIDASAFTGVQFTISGAVSGCAMQYATGDVEHQDPVTGAPYAAGGPGSYPPQATIAATEVTAAPQTLKIPFAGNLSFGSPATPVDPKKLILVLWQLTIPTATGTTQDAAAASCTADLTIDNVTFY
jgi:hypothetical protein